MPRQKYTYEDICAAALQCDTPGEFKKNDRNAYAAAQYRGILDEVCAHMKRRVCEAWTDEKIIQRALRWDTRWKFQKNDISAYRAARRRGILDEVCAHMRRVCEAWTDEKIIQRALRWNTPGEFKKNDKNAYAAAQYRGILDEVCAHMRSALDLTSYLYTYKTPDMCVYVGISFDVGIRREQHLKNSPDYIKDIIENGELEVFSRPVEYSGKVEPYPLPQDVALRLERFAIHRLSKQGYHVYNKTHCPQYDWSSGTWDHPELPIWFDPHVEDALNARDRDSFANISLDESPSSVVAPF